MRSLSLMSFLLLLRRASSSSALVPPHASSAAAAAAATTTSSATTRIVPKVRAGAVRMGAMKKAARNQKAAGGPMGPKAKQSLGQNFLTDEALAIKIAQAIEGSGDGGSRVFELGPGQGAITGHLLKMHPEMTAVELDDRMIQHLQTTLPDLGLQHGDMLQLDFESLAAERGGRLSLVSNTPFYLTSPLLFKLSASTEHVAEAVLTMQREVAMRVLSRPNSKQYGPLSVMLQLFGSPDLLFDLPPEAFEPAPKVTSSVLRFTPSPVPAGEEEALSPAQRASLLGLLKLTFETRRKMLRVSLKKLLASGAVARPPEEFLTLRPEQLSPSQWLQLARSLFGDDLAPATQGGADGARTANGASQILERHHVSKSWKAHKAGYDQDNIKQKRAPTPVEE